MSDVKGTSPKSGTALPPADIPTLGVGGRRSEESPLSRLTVEFCGEVYPLTETMTFSVGREGDLVIDEDNAYLHRRLIEFRHEQGFWWIANVGSRLSITISGGAGTLQSWIGPGSRLPVVLPRAAVLFTAGETTYELDVVCDLPAFENVRESPLSFGDETLGAVELTSSQFKLILALAESTLRRAGTGSSDLPTNAKAAERLGWSITTFNRKLDNVCDKFSRAGVKGLRGGSGQLATNRRSRLVEYTVAARVVRPEHLTLLEDDAEDSA